MALETTFRELSLSLHKLHEALDALQIIVGDRPPEDGAAVVDEPENSMLDVMGALHEATEGARKAQDAIHPFDLDCVRRALSVCQDGFHRVTQVFFRKLLSREELTELGNLGNERGGEWLPWANGTKEVIWDCRLLLEDVSRSIGHCWQEAAEHAGATSVSVRTTNIGQKIISTSSATELGFERAT
jgi:hypothetical protein